MTNAPPERQSLMKFGPLKPLADNASCPYPVDTPVNEKIARRERAAAGGSFFKFA